MKINLFFIALLLSLSFTVVSVTGCSVGGHVGPIGAGAAVN